MKHAIALLLVAAMLCLLCGCGSVFDKEYVVVSAYTPTPADSSAREGRVTVRNLAELRAALRNMVSAGETERRIQFDSAYDGDVTEDLASACWQVRTQDALCAYCVENMAYDLSMIVSHYEADIFVSYSPAALGAEDIIQMQYAAGLEDTVREALEQGKARLVVLLGSSVYSAEDMENLVTGVYRSCPASAPKEPTVSVNLFSGAGRQRLYEIRLRYGLSSTELENRRLAMAAFEPFEEGSAETLSADGRALLACRWLMDHCAYDPGAANDIYSALIVGEANSEGMALGYVELCRRLNLPCQIVYGQRNWENRCWNIVELDGVYYHVDPAACSVEGLNSAFLLNDEQAWSEYRWDVSAYPACSGEAYQLEQPAEELQVTEEQQGTEAEA